MRGRLSVDTILDYLKLLFFIADSAHQEDVVRLTTEFKIVGFLVDTGTCISNFKEREREICDALCVCSN